MSPQGPQNPPTNVRGILRGLGEVAAFLRESAIAVFEVAIGRWPKPYDGGARKPKAPSQGMGPIKKIAPYPTDD